MTKSWGPLSGADLPVDLTVRCGGKRLIRVHRGEPAFLQVARTNHGNDDLVLVGDEFDLRALVAAGHTETPRARTWRFECPNHRGGHDVDGRLLRDRLLLARQSSGQSTIAVGSVATSPDAEVD